MELYKLTIAVCAIVMFIKVLNSPLVAQVLEGGCNGPTMLAAFAMLLAALIGIVKIVVIHSKNRQE